MFKNTIVNLSRSPSSAGELKREINSKQRDQKLRGLGLLFVALTIGMMVFGNTSASENSVTASPSNDIIVGGIATGTDGLGDSEREAKMKQNTIDAMRSVKFTSDVYEYYNITEADINASSLREISTDNAALHSVGRQYFGEVTKENSKNGTKFYERTINSAYGGRSRDVLALVGTRQSAGEDGYNRYFAIIVSCGNPVLSYSEELSPRLEIEKSSTPEEGSIVEPGQDITYEIAYRNIGGARADNFKVNDLVPDSTQLVRINNNGTQDSSQGESSLVWGQINGGSLEISRSWSKVSFTVKVDTSTADQTEICNSASVSADRAAVASNKVCHTVVNQPSTESLCKSLGGILVSDRDVKLTVRGVAGTTAESVQIEHNKKEIASLEISPDQEFSSTYTTEADVGLNNYIATIIDANGSEITSDSCILNININPNCYNAEEAAEDQSGFCPEATLSFHKTAQNLTDPGMPITSPDSSEAIKASAGDKIEYVITYENIGKTHANNVTPVSDDVSDLLEYATITETGGAALNRFNGVSELDWSDLAFDLGPGDRRTLTFIAEVNNSSTSCNTPTPVNSGGEPNIRSFDCVLENKYGSSTTFVELTPGIGKQVQEVAKSLPSTGSAQVMLVSLAVLSVSVFSFYRTHLISQELKVAKQIHRGER